MRLNETSRRLTASVTPFVAVTLLFLCSASGQTPFTDGFEDGNCDDWTLWIGTRALSTTQVHQGNYSVWLQHPDDYYPAVMLPYGFGASQGVFEAWFRVSNGYECNAMVSFQASDISDNYTLSCMPYYLDGNSYIVLSRTVADVETTLVDIGGPGLIPSEEWFKMRVHRYADGLIKIFTEIGGVESLRASVRDSAITGYRPFAVGGWGGVYVDDIRYDTLCCVGRVGDVNGDGAAEPSLGDIALMIDAKFISMSCSSIPCLAEADVNHSGGASPTCDDLSIGDISTLIDYLFITGPSLGLPDCW